MTPPARTPLRAFLASARKALASAPATASKARPVTFVIGNEAADLDSLCSALFLAYFRTYHHHHTKPGQQQQSFHIPLANVPRADLALKPEFGAVLRHAGASLDDVLTLSDFPFAPHSTPPRPTSSSSPSPPTTDQGARPEGDADAARQSTKQKVQQQPPPFLSPEQTKWILVDHNALTGPLAAAGFSAAVVGCVDHHDDEGAVPPRDGTTDDNDVPRVIGRCGSCMTLVVGECRAAWEDDVLRPRRGSSSSAEDEDEDRPAAIGILDGQLARLGLGPILSDTQALTAAEKTTSQDVKAGEFLEGIILRAGRGGGDSGSSSGSSSHDRMAYHVELERLKADISGMTYRDVLRKDYKRWEERATAGGGSVALGVSAVPRGFAYMFKCVGDAETGLFLAMRRWAEEQRLDMVVVMTALRTGGEGEEEKEEEGKGPEGKGDFARQLLVWALNEEAARAARRFEDRFAGELRLERWGEGRLDLREGEKHEGRGEWRKGWRQWNVGASRKMVGPMLRAAVRGEPKL